MCDCEFTSPAPGSDTSLDALDLSENQPPVAGYVKELTLEGWSLGELPVRRTRQFAFNWVRMIVSIDNAVRKKEVLESATKGRA